MDEASIRIEMGQNLDRMALHDRQEELRRALAEIDIPGADEITERWREQAGTKPPIDEGRPVIVSPGESGGGGGG